MNLDKQNQCNFLDGKFFPVVKQNFRLSLELHWDDFGFGFLLYKPLYKSFPRKNYRLGITLRISWIILMLKVIEMKPYIAQLEFYEKLKMEKELTAFFNKELIAFQNNSRLNVSWNWQQFGLMLFCQRRQSENHGHYSLSVLWTGISYY